MTITINHPRPHKTRHWDSDWLRAMFILEQFAQAEHCTYEVYAVGLYGPEPTLVAKVTPNPLDSTPTASTAAGTQKSPSRPTTGMQPRSGRTSPSKPTKRNVFRQKPNSAAGRQRRGKK